MTYNSASLSAISYANGFTLWHYRSDDTAAMIMAPGYFNPAHKMMRQGDFVFVNASMMAKESEHGCIVVRAVDSKSIVVSADAGFSIGAKP